MAFNFSNTTLDRPSPGLSVAAADHTRRELSRGNLRYRLPVAITHQQVQFSSAS